MRKSADHVTLKLLFEVEERIRLKWREEVTSSWAASMRQTYADVLDAIRWWECRKCGHRNVDHPTWHGLANPNCTQCPCTFYIPRE